MRSFRCTCGQPLFFENQRCLSCRRHLGFDPLEKELLSLEPDGAVWAAVVDPGRRFRRCANDLRHGLCNWLVSPAEEAAETGPLCLSCRRTITIPNLGRSENRYRWRRLEAAKRRLLYTLLDLDLPLDGEGSLPALTFDFIEDQRTNPDVEESFVLTGHRRGRITLHAAEADDVFREAQRDALNQRYRTVLGHLRHESGHYFWELLVRQRGRTEEFRALFGDERADYDEALATFYRSPPEIAAGERFISPYAAAHPFEDWAESWKHFLHAVDTLETARVRGMAPAVSLRDDFGSWLDTWIGLTVSLNELNRSMGLPDAYPFVIGPAVREKLRFIRSVVYSVEP